jgi:hypothetical protein
MPFGIGLTVRGYVLLGCAATVAPIYVVLGADEYLYLALLLASLPMASAMLTALYLVSGRLNVESGFALVAVEGEEVSIRVKLPHGFLKPLAAEGGGDCESLVLRAGELECRVRAFIGTSTVRLPSLVLADALELAFTRIGLGYVLVKGVPKPVAPRAIPQAPLAATKPSRSGDEVLYTREAEPVEPPTRIDWKATARLGKPIAKVLGGTSLSAPELVLVATPSSTRGPRGSTVFEEEARFLVGLVEALSRLGLRPRVRLLLGSSLDVAFEAATAESVARAIAEYRWGDRALPSDLDRLETDRCTVVLVGPDPEYVPRKPCSLAVLVVPRGARVEPPEGVLAVTSPDELAKLVLELVGAR